MSLTRKTLQQLSAVANGQNTKKRVENLPVKIRKPVNHWAVLDEIEAPMWADLTLECDSTYEDKDDEWFHISHLFHQCSTRKLISTFSRSAEHCMNSSFDLQGPSSPKLPSSVSKSRGSENAIENNAYDEKVNNHLNHVSVDESTSSRTTALVFSKSASSFSDKNTSAKSVAFGVGESNSTGTITSKATAGKVIDTSSQPFGSARGLLNIRNGLRKSTVTRQASRVEIECTRRSEDLKSSSSKSSVGSSLHPGYDGMNPMVTRNMENTPDSINIKKMSQLPSNKVYQANVHKGPTQAQKMRDKSYSHMNQEASKTMDQKKHKESYVSKANNSMRARGTGLSSRTIGIGKENQSGKMASAIKASIRMKEAECPLRDPKVVKKKTLQTSDRTKLAGPTDNRCSGNEEKKSVRKVETVYFR